MKFRYYIYQYLFINFLILFLYCFYLYFFNYSELIIEISRERYAITYGILDIIFGLFFPLALLPILIPIFFAKIVCYGSKATKLAKSIALLCIVFFMILFSWIVDVKGKYAEVKDLDIDYMVQNLQTKQVKFFHQPIENPGSRSSYYKLSYVFDMERQENMIISCTIAKISSCWDVEKKRFDGQVYNIKYYDAIDNNSIGITTYLFEIVGVKDRTTDYYVLKYKTVIDKRKSFTLFAVFFYLNSLIMVINFLRKG